MKAEDKSKPVKVTVSVHPAVERALRGLMKFHEDSSADHIVSEAIKDAAKDKRFQEWFEKNSSSLAGATDQPKAAKKMKAEGKAA